MDDISLALNPPRFVKSRRTKRPIPIARSSSPVWPLPAVNGREPVIVTPATQQARGIEIAYSRVQPADAVDVCPPGSPSGTTTHLMPQMAAALSMDDGEIMFAGRHGHGYAMIVNHGNGWSSYYANLKGLCAVRTDLYRPRAQYVRAGDVIGYVGAPAPGEFQRLYFEVWQLDRKRHFVPVDALARLADAKLIQHYDERLPAPPAIARKEAA